MKKLVKSYRAKNYNNIKLFLEDLSSIYDKIKSISDRTRIRDHENEYDDLSDLQSHSSEQISYIEICGIKERSATAFTSETIEFIFSINGSSLSTMQYDQADIRAAFLEIDNKIKDKRVITSKALISTKFIAIFIGCLVLASGLKLLIPIFIPNATTQEIKSLALLLTMLVLFGSSFLLSGDFFFGKPHPLSLVRKKDQKSFFYQHKKELILIIITAVISAVTTALVQKVL